MEQDETRKFKHFGFLTIFRNWMNEIFYFKRFDVFFFFHRIYHQMWKKLSQNLAPKRLGFVRCNLSVVVSGQTWPGSGVMPSPQVPPPTYHAANNTSQHNLCVFCYKSALTWTISQRRRWGRWNSSHPNTFKPPLLQLSDPVVDRRVRKHQVPVLKHRQAGFLTTSVHLLKNMIYQR